MKNTLRVDHKNGTIIMDRTFAKLSQNTMSNEYAHLQNVRRDYPTYTVVRHTIKKNTSKETYNGNSGMRSDCFHRKSGFQLFRQETDENKKKKASNPKIQGFWSC